MSADTTLDEDILKDIGDALATEAPWIPALMLYPADKNVLEDENGWLNDSTIRAAQVCLHKQFPDVGGLDDPLLVAAHRKHYANQKYVQVLHDGSCHWVAVSNLNASQSTVRLYDSLSHVPNSSLKGQIAALSVCEEKQLVIECMKVARHKGVHHCELYALAFVTSELFGANPLCMTYNQELMRSHLKNCLENECMQPFPATAIDVPISPILRTIAVEIQCLCRQASNKKNATLVCSGCKEHYHPKCILSAADCTKFMTTKTFRMYCPLCKNITTNCRG